MYTALYRSERPEVFDEVLGQEHIVKILRHQIETGTVSHAYLFCGTRGTGKTTMARLLAKAVNCTSDDNSAKPCGTCANCEAIKNGNFIDVIEIDAASNNGVENIREINESVKFPPSVGKTKVYIIDEVHMLSTGAFNALLKTLEEPPENVMFILATTEPQKLPQTILSRCMKLDFRRVPENTLAEGMNKICKERGVELTEDALKLLVSNADGSVRDGLSILEQCLATGEKKIDRDLILEFLGTAGDEFFIELTGKILTGNLSEAMMLVNDAVQEGKDVKQLIKDLTSHYRNLLIAKFVTNPEDMLNMSTENIDKLKTQSDQIETDEINNAIVILSKTVNEARWSTQPRILLEMAIVQMANATSGVAPRPQVNKKTVANPTPKPEPKLESKQEPKPELELETLPHQGLKQEPTSNPTDEQELEIEKPEEEKSTSDLSDGELDSLLEKIIDKASKEKISVNMLRNMARLIKKGEDAYAILVNSDTIKMTVESVLDSLKKALAQELGKEVSLNAETSKDQKKEEPEENIAQKISEKFKIKVEEK